MALFRSLVFCKDLIKPLIFCLLAFISNVFVYCYMTHSTEKGHIQNLIILWQYALKGFRQFWSTFLLMVSHKEL